jgi:copper chaperone CopZ
MTVMRLTFEVDQAGCPSCADRVRAALSDLATVEEIVVDDKAVRARVVISCPQDLREEIVNEALLRASGGSGHEYRVRTGSWPGSG